MRSRVCEAAIIMLSLIMSSYVMSLFFNKGTYAYGQTNNIRTYRYAWQTTSKAVF